MASGHDWSLKPVKYTHTFLNVHSAVHESNGQENLFCSMKRVFGIPKLIVGCNDRYYVLSPKLIG